MTNFAELKARQDAERLAEAAAKAKAAPKQTISDAKLIRSRHVGLRRKLTVAEAKTVTAAFKQRLNKTAYDIMREEEQAKREADLEGGERQAQRSDAPLLASAVPASPIPVPPGRDRDSYLAEEREADIGRRVSLEALTAGLDLDPVTARILRLLLAHSQPRGKNQGEPGWRTIDLAAIGADPFLILGLDPPPAPVASVSTHLVR
jgi:hypothetical protein